MLFEAEDYVAAMPLYSGLLANDKEDPGLNYRYGVCVLFASSDKDQALSFLEKASKSPGVEPDVWYYLGRAYHLNYQFDQAIVAYSKFKTVAGEKKSEKLQVDNQIAMCKTGKKMLKAITDIYVIDKAELSELDFWRRYDLTTAGYSGQLLVKPDDFKTPLDKKKGENSIIFLAGEKNELAFSSYGNDESNGKDIYIVNRLPNGQWGKPINPGYPINTEYDEDYPFLHPNGKVLYFSSKGHNSMGGYDIFRSEYNDETNSWEKPVNVDFAINSTDDDILFVTDYDESTAYFASNRNSPKGKMTVYHVQIKRKPVNLVLVKGNFHPSEGDYNYSADITVKNSSGETVGTYKSSAAGGGYFITLPNNGGKYSFTVEHRGVTTQTESVLIPPQYSIKAISQVIGYKDESGDRKLFIATDLESDTSMLDPIFLKDKAKLDIKPEDNSAMLADNSNSNENQNTDQSIDTAASDSSITENNPGDQHKTTNVSNAELVSSAYEDADATQNDASTLKTQTDRAYNYAMQLNSQAKEKQKEATDAKNAADAMADGPDKQNAEDKAAQLQSQANALESQTVAALEIADAMNNDATQKQKEADETKSYATALDQAVNKNDSKALTAAEKMEGDLKAMTDVRSNQTETVNNLQDESAKKHQELDKATADAKDMRDDITMKSDKIVQLESDKSKEKDADARAQIDQQIAGIKEDVDDDKQQLAKDDANVKILQNETNDLDNQLAAAKNTVSQSKNTSISSAPVSADDKKQISSDAVAYQQVVNDNGNARTFAPPTNLNNDQNVVINQNQNQINNQQSNTNNQNVTDNQNQNTDQHITDNQNQNQVNNQQSNTNNQDSAVDMQAVNEQYTSELSQTDGISDPVKKQNEIARIDSTWAATIDDQVKAKNYELAGTTDKKQQAAIKKDIAQLQKDEKQKQNDAVKAENNAKIAGQQSTANTNVAAANTDKQFQDQLAVAGKSSDSTTAKADIYDDWADTLNAQADAKQKEFQKTHNKTKQDQLSKEITDLRQQANDKQALAVQERQNSMVAEQHVNEQQNNQSQQHVNYDAAAAQNSIKEKEDLTLQADGLHHKQDSLTNAASNANGDAKDKLLAQATDAQRQAWEKESQASAKQGEANRAQFNSNTDQLKNYENGSANNDDPSVASAQLLSDESVKLFGDAKTERQKADSASDPYTKDIHQKAAEEKEKQALQKQQDALADYKKAGVTPLVANNQNQNVDQHVTDNQNQINNQQSSVNNQNVDQHVTDNQNQNNNQQSSVNNQNVDQHVTDNQNQNNNQQSSVNNQNVDQHVTDNQNQNNNQQSITHKDIIDPSNGKVMSSEKADSIKNSSVYNSFASKNAEAVKSDDEASRLNKLGETYQSDANQNISQAQDFAMQAADETDPNKKQVLVDQSKKYNEAAKSDLTKRDSVNAMAGTARIDATDKHKTADQLLQGLDAQQQSDVKAVANAENPNAKIVADNQNQINDQQSSVNNQNVDQHVTDNQNQINNQQSSVNNQNVDQHVTDNQNQNQINNQQSNINNQTSVVNRLAPGEELKLHTNTAAVVEMNPQLPEGVIYKVQIGAFRNPIPMDLFKNVQPVTGEPAGSGLTRYTAGKFTNFKNADDAKNEIRAIGYKDAFVVAYCNGKRVSIADSYNCSGQNGNQQQVVVDQNQNNNQQNQINDQQSSVNNQNVANAKDVSEVKGLFYTVQVGVYNTYSNDARLQHLRGLFTSKAPNGQIRYSSGKYNDVNSAIATRRTIVAHGATDAFVTAYYDGERISIAQAQELEKEGKTSPTPEVEGGYEDGVPNNSQQNNSQQQSANNNQQNNSQQQSANNNQQNNSQQQSANNNQQNNSQQQSANNNQQNNSQQQSANTDQQNNSSSTDVVHTSSSEFIPDTGIVFCVQLGAFQGQVPLEIATKILRFSSQGVKNYYDSETGLTYYQVGMYVSKDEADVLKNDAVQKGITDAFIVAWKNGKKVPLEDAVH
ncbi:MAG: PD40 domain-containing protein [Bacteroidetes bacterium]|nr:PD40 domain-containing protein [Bacteroidota bacterium]